MEAAEFQSYLEQLKSLNGSGVAQAVRDASALALLSRHHQRVIIATVAGDNKEAAQQIRAAIRDAKPAAGLAEEKSETPAFVQAIRASREISQTSYALFEIAECLAGQLEINNVCGLIGERIDNAVPFDPNTDTCVFYWFDDECREASVQHITGANAEKFAGCSIKPGEGVTGWVLVNGKPFSNTDPALDLYILSLSKGINDQFPKYQTLAVFPLAKGEEMLGAMAKMGVKVEKHHHEVASAQHELGMKFDTMTLMADFTTPRMPQVVGTAQIIPGRRFPANFRQLVQMVDFTPTSYTGFHSAIAPCLSRITSRIKAV